MRILFSLALLLAVYSGHSATYYVSTNGTSGGTGAIASTWDLQTAFNKTGTLVAGDLVWIRGGNYTHTPQGTNNPPGYIFTVAVAGNSSSPITFRAYPNERASIDGSAYPGSGANTRQTINIPNNYVTFQDLEIYSSSTEARVSGTDASFPPDITRSDGPYAQGTGIKFINCIVHDLTSGLSSFGNNSKGDEFYGNLVSNNGWQGTPHVHGHGLYMQGPVSNGGLTKLVKRNILVGAYDKNAQIYGSSTSEIAHFNITENAVVGQEFVHGGFLVGSRNGGATDRIQDITFNGNFGYGADLNLYYQQDDLAYKDMICVNNYFYLCFWQISSWKTATITNNVFIAPGNSAIVSIWPNTGAVVLPWAMDRNSYTIPTLTAAAFSVQGEGARNFTNWKTRTAFDANSTIGTAVPAGTNYVILQDNAYDTNRAQVIVYNWTLGNSITLNLAAMNWGQGSSVVVHNAQDYYGDAPSQTISLGNTISLDMQAASHTVAVPFGDTVALVPKTFPNFGVFILQNLGGGSAPPPPVTTVLQVNSTTPNSGVAIQMTPADINGLSNGSTPFTRNAATNSITTLTAPLAAAGGNVFSLWQRNGATYSTNLSATFTNVSDLVFNALYGSPAAPATASGTRAASAVRRGVRF